MEFNAGPLIGLGITVLFVLIVVGFAHFGKSGDKK